MNFLYLLLITYKFVSLVPSVTEIFYALNAQDNLLAISFYCNYPQETVRKKKVGDLLNPDFEKILKLKPDFVILTLPMQAEVAKRLEKLNIKYLAFTPESVNEILNTIDSVAKLTGRIERGSFLIDSLKNVLSEVKPLPKKPKVYIELSDNPIYTVGRGSFLNEVVELAGGENIFKNRNQPYFVPSQEEIVKLNPDVIFLIYPEAQRKKVEKRLGWEKVKAVKNGKIYTLDPDVFTRPGPRIFGAILKLNRLLQTSL